MKVFTVDFPAQRPFSWRAWLLLVMLYFLGNLGGLPLLRKTGAPVEPVWFWGLATLIAALIIALSLLMASRSALGASLLEGRLAREALPAWLRSGLALTALTCVIGFPFSLLANLSANPATYPFGWELLPASFKAGVVEELVARLFLVSLFAWLGKLVSRSADGRPSRAVYWAAILLPGLLFGWGHVDAQLGNPAAPLWGLALSMVLNAALGTGFGWLFWKLGLEWAMFAHFAYDAFISMIVVPVYLANSPLAWAALLSGLVLAAVFAWRTLAQKTPGGSDQEKRTP